MHFVASVTTFWRSTRSFTLWTPTNSSATTGEDGVAGAYRLVTNIGRGAGQSGSSERLRDRAVRSS